VQPTRVAVHRGDWSRNSQDFNAISPPALWFSMKKMTGWPRAKHSPSVRHTASGAAQAPAARDVSKSSMRGETARK
jgi:hypothetical protein